MLCRRNFVSLTYLKLSNTFIKSFKLKSSFDFVYSVTTLCMCSLHVIHFNLGWQEEGTRVWRNLILLLFLSGRSSFRTFLHLIHLGQNFDS